MKKIIILILLGISLYGCKKDCTRCTDPTNIFCENYDSCYGEKPVTADFQIKQFSLFLPHQFDENEGIVFGRARLKFVPKEGGAKYTWKLGRETITDSSFYREFYKTPYGEYQVTLMVEKEPNKRCFPNDDGKDTLTKTFRLVSGCDLNSSGIFKGLFEGEKDSSIISIVNISQRGSDTCSNLNLSLTNLENKGNTVFLAGQDRMIQFNNKIAFEKITTYLNNPFGGSVEYNPNNNTCKMEYSIFQGRDKKALKYKFNGRKIK